MVSAISGLMQRYDRRPQALCTKEIHSNYGLSYRLRSLGQKLSVCFMRVCMCACFPSYIFFLLSNTPSDM